MNKKLSSVTRAREWDAAGSAARQPTRDGRKQAPADDQRTPFHRSFRPCPPGSRCRLLIAAALVGLSTLNGLTSLAARGQELPRQELPRQELPRQELPLTLRYEVETEPGSGRYHRLVRQEAWNARETAIIVCDVWDLHHCLNAVRRLNQFVPRLNELLSNARERGVTVIHSPSDCMPAYHGHPARKRAQDAPPAADLPAEIGQWCSRIPQEEQAQYPIDQSDGGEDDDPAEHAFWAAQLRAFGRNPATPWKRQSAGIAIDPQHDFLSDRGDEVWNVLRQRGIRNVILTGVHTNMCVLGRPFGLRQMARNGMRVVLMRDLTDTMYNPRSWPFVSHLTGTDLVIAHVERFVAPTITSDQLLGGQPFRFAEDRRPHLVVVMAEQGYRTAETLPAFALRQLGQDFRLSYVYADPRQPHAIPGLEVLDEADAVLLSVRRRALPRESMERLRRLVAAGKPVIGIRTASHAFSLRGGEPPEGSVTWPTFDREVFGAAYEGDLGKEVSAVLQIAGQPDPLLAGIAPQSFRPGYSVYRFGPLARGCRVFLTAALEDNPPAPAGWTYRREDGGRSAYLALGHPADFAQPVFQQLLRNAIYWAAGLPIPAQPAAAPQPLVDYWTVRDVPDRQPAALSAAAPAAKASWYRCVIRLPRAWAEDRELRLRLAGGGNVRGWLNGQLLAPAGADDGPGEGEWVIPLAARVPDDAHLLVLRIAAGDGPGHLEQAPIITAAGGREFKLRGRWQVHLGDEPQLSNMPLPAKFGTGTDVVFEPPSDTN